MSVLLDVKNLKTYFNVGLDKVARAVDGVSFTIDQGKTNLQAIWILLPTFITLSATLTMLTFVGEGIRNAFDPKRNN